MKVEAQFGQRHITHALVQPVDRVLPQAGPFEKCQRIPLVSAVIRGFTRISIAMTRPSPFGHPFLLGFDEIEQALDRVAKAANDGYPPYNIERVQRTASEPERLRITLAVAGFTRDQLEIVLEENQLLVRGRQVEERAREFLHRGIAARQFQRAFLLADGMEVLGADLSNGLLSIDLARPEPERVVRKIQIASRDP